MENIGIFFGSDTGNTENIADKIQRSLSSATLKASIYDIADVSSEEVKKFNIILLGAPTWYYGELQCDWEEFLPCLSKLNFKNKHVGLFGCGDQEDYSEYFCDALGTVYNAIKQENINIIGKWPTMGYNFEQSKSLIDKNNFIGLTIDEDRQPELTEQRVERWTLQICKELNLQVK